MHIRHCRSVTRLFLFVALLFATATAQVSDRATADFYHARASAAFASGDYERAVADFDQALLCDPRNVRILNDRGLTWLALEDAGLALRDFKRAVRLAPDFAAAWRNRGIARYRRGQWQKTVRDCVRAISLDRQDALAWAYRGLALRQQGREAEAASDFRESLALDAGLRAMLEKQTGLTGLQLTARR